MRGTSSQLRIFSMIMQEPFPQAAVVLLRHPGLRLVRGHGALLPHDGFPPSLRLLSRKRLISFKTLAFQNDF